MTRNHQTPLGAAGRGLLAGAAGTAVMTVAQTAYYKVTDNESSSTPAEVGRRIVEGVGHRTVPEHRMPALNQVMHWLYGTSWGVAYGVAAESVEPRRPVAGQGLAFALTVWAASRSELTAMRLAPPPWQDPPKMLVTDVGFHVVYGLAVAGAHRAFQFSAG